MSDFTDYIGRSDIDANSSVPVMLAQELVQGMTKQSAALAFGHTMDQSAFVNIVPSESNLPKAYWNYPDSTPTSLLQTTKMSLALNTLEALEMGTLVPIFQDELDDSQLPLWDVVKPRVTEAMAVLLDNAVIWGVGAPSIANPSVLATILSNNGGRLSINPTTTTSSTVVQDTSAITADSGSYVYGPGIPSSTTISAVSAGTSYTLSHAATIGGSANNLAIVPASTASPFVVQATDLFTGGDSAKYVLQAAQAIGQCGYSPTNAWVAGGWQFRNMASRTQLLTANPVGSDAFPLLLGGLPLAPFAGAGRGPGVQGTGPVWNAFADTIVGDWSSLKIGLRQDIQMTMHPDGIISNGSGVVTFNAMQARGVVLRASARYSWAIIPPLVADTSYTGARSTFASVMNTGTAGLVGGPMTLDNRPTVPITADVGPNPDNVGVRESARGRRK